MSLRSCLLVPARRAAFILSSLAALAWSSLGAGCGAGEGESGEASAGGGDTPACPEAESAEITAQNEHGTLAGTLEVPAGCGPFPAVVILPGSGPTDRDGNNAPGGVASNAYKLLAQGLRDRGIASIRYDKAGIGGSASAAPRAEQDMRFTMGADDAGLWVKKLRDDGRFATVTVVGHSEGSLLGMLVARTTEVDGYVSIAGAGRPIGDVLREQLAGLPDEDRAKAYEILGQLERGERVADVPQTPLFQSLFRPSVQPYLISWMKLDPAVELAAVAAPVLLVQGTTDTQVPVRDAELLAAARPDAELVIIEGMSHTLKEATLEPASQQAAYTDPSLPVMPRLIEALAAFIPAG
ncbi:alpha/beta hydrolase [Sorangium cellulosum]|uniref:Alpha/beta hydrolase n=1 Tax=Sorangium cellulosum TaxID=56 RepID=A0A4P2PT18_SORCE|nr:alpha/beta fold hydrolase [Sorangium cellulosum]AUX19765.1 alpha/beta hydrolase [Sorangium cellulosum]